MIKIDGIVVVEGKDDKTALSRVIEPEKIYILNGMSGANQKKIDDLKRLAKNNKVAGYQLLHLTPVVVTVSFFPFQ